MQPVRGESVRFDETGNAVIEGDNLEVLKLLQKSYNGKIKMIYIDPPYNTGNEFIYPDNFREGLQDYLRYSGQLDGDGFATNSNSERDGRYHSKWLSMMYPRLFLAKNLLREDGVIFVSIDDNEVANLRLLMDEIFGEENFIDAVVWKKRYGGGAKEKHLVTLHEYILFYAKSSDNLDTIFIPNTEESIARYYKLKDANHETRGPYRTHPLEATKSMGDRANLIYPIPGPDGSEIWPKRQWLWGKERALAALQNNELELLRGQDGWTVHTKQYLKDESGNIRQSKAFSIIDNVYSQHGTNEIIDVFGDARAFSFPKPTGLIKPLLNIATDASTEDIILDFFAGSGTTAQAVLELNKEDGGDRKFILVQLPEKTASKQYPSIADITRGRVRRVIGRMDEADAGKLALDGEASRPDRGFKAFRLASSNFKIWDGGAAGQDQEEISRQLALFADNVLPDASPEGILFEILIKGGYELSVPREEILVAGHPVTSVSGGSLLACLERPVTRALLDGMIALAPKQVVCLDEAFHGDDSLLTNIVLQMKDAGVEFRTI